MSASSAASSSSSAVARASFWRIARRSGRPSRVERQDRRHHPGGGDGLDLAAPRPAAAQQGRDERADRVPPLLRVGFGPPGRGREQRDLLLRGRQHALLGVDQRAFDGRGADVDARAAWL